MQLYNEKTKNWLLVKEIEKNGATKVDNEKMYKDMDKRQGDIAKAIGENEREENRGKVGNLDISKCCLNFAQNDNFTQCVPLTN